MLKLCVSCVLYSHRLYRPQNYICKDVFLAVPAKLLFSTANMLGTFEFCGHLMYDTTDRIHYASFCTSCQIDGPVAPCGHHITHESACPHSTVIQCESVKTSPNNLNTITNLTLLKVSCLYKQYNLSKRSTCYMLSFWQSLRSGCLIHNGI